MASIASMVPESHVIYLSRYPELNGIINVDNWIKYCDELSITNINFTDPSPTRVLSIEDCRDMDLAWAQMTAFCDECYARYKFPEVPPPIPSDITDRIDLDAFSYYENDGYYLGFWTTIRIGEVKASYRSRLSKFVLFINEGACIEDGPVPSRVIESFLGYNNR